MKRLLTTLLLVTVMLPLMAQNPDFDRKLESARALYSQGQFEKARTAIKNTLKNLPSLSSAQIQQGNQLVSQCDQAIANRDRLDISVTAITMPFGSVLDSVHFVAAKPTLVTATSSAPGWCKIEAVRNDHVYLRTQMNPDKAPRSAQVTVAMGKIKKRSFTVTQEARPETIKGVRITTRPNRSRLMVDGGMAVIGTWEGRLDAGSHRIRAEKSGYFPKDTVITVADDLKDDQMVLDIPLAPSFGMLKIDVLPQEGFSFNEAQPYQLRVNGRIVENLNYSYDDDRDIERYVSYEDGTIPVPAGRVSILASADAFETESKEIQIDAGELVNVSLLLKAKYGRLSLIDTGKARDAQVSIDGKNVGTVQEITSYPLGIGEHVITLEKPGFISQENAYNITMKENEDVNVNVTMYRFVPYVFESTPADARVIINGEHIGNTPTKPYMLKEFEPNQAFEVVLEKDGYLSWEKTLTPDFDNHEVVTLSQNLHTTHKLTFSGDEDNLKLYIKNGKDGDSTLVDGVILPAEVYLPVRNKPYYLAVRQIGKKQPVYRKHLKFNSPDAANQYKLRVWGSGATTLSGSMFLTGNNDISIGNEDIGAKSYKHLVDVKLATFRLFPGLSTSVLRGSLYTGTDKGSFESETGSVSVLNEQFLPAISVMFINGDFRVGGTVLDYADVNFLASYAWYPPLLKQIVGFSHITGHDVFVGVEVASRIRYINVGLKAGWQMYPDLTANLYNNVNNSKNDVKDNYIECPMNVPNMFVVGVELSLGGKGKSIWRVFY